MEKPSEIAYHLTHLTLLPSFGFRVAHISSFECHQPVYIEAYLQETYNANDGFIGFCKIHYALARGKFPSLNHFSKLQSFPAFDSVQPHPPYPLLPAPLTNVHNQFILLRKLPHQIRPRVVLDSCIDLAKWQFESPFHLVSQAAATSAGCCPYGTSSWVGWHHGWRECGFGRVMRTWRRRR